MANPELGAKQICPNCQTKFYDLGRRPAVCPKCGETFDPEEAVRSRRVRARATPPDYETEDEPETKTNEEDVEGFEEEVEETPEIDEAVEAEPVETEEGEDVTPTPTPGAGDLGVDFEEEAADLDEDADEDVPFLEEDEDFTGEDIEGLPGEDHDGR